MPRQQKEPCLRVMHQLYVDSNGSLNGIPYQPEKFIDGVAGLA